MKKTTKNRTSSIFKSITIGLVAAIITTTVMLALTGWLIQSESVSEKTSRLFIMATQFIATFIGALIAGKTFGSKYAVVCGFSVVAYLFILTTTAILFFQSQFGGVGSSIGMCCAGFAAACAICTIKKDRNRRRK